MKKLIALLLAVVMVLGLAACGSANDATTQAQDNPATTTQAPQNNAADKYPEKAVRIIIPFGAGGSTDLGGRVVAQYLQKYLPGSSFPVENQGGGNAVPGTLMVLQDDPNATGYVLGYNWYASFNFRPQFLETATYTMDDFTMICGMTTQRNTLFIRKDETRFHDVDSLIKYIKDHPGELNYGCGAANSWQLLIMLNFLNAYGVADLCEEVPQASAREVALQVLGGNLDFCLLETASFSAELEVDGIATICSFESNRNPVHPDCPTIGELGHPEVADVAANCLVLCAPKGLDEGIRAKLEEACRKMCEDPDFLAESKNCKQDILFQTGAEVTAALKNSMPEVLKLLKQAGMVKD
jgi:tripartite-type tricarboxylate transporter receptor subunit TctC